MRAASWLFAALLSVVALLSASLAPANGVWDTEAGTYRDNLRDLAGFEKVQAVELVASGGEVQLASHWTIHQPTVPPAETGSDEPFGASGSEVDFASITQDGANGEQVRLYQRWFGAVRDTLWRDECPPGIWVGQLHDCYIFPVSEVEETLRGAKESEVLLCPDVRSFNDCHYWDNPMQAKSCPAVPLQNQGRPDLVSIFLHSQNHQELFVAGAPFNVTWWIRSPGEHAAPGIQPGGGLGSYNKRLIGMRIDFSYTIAGGPPVVDNWLGGATRGALEPIDCIAPNTGCPVRVSLHNDGDYTNAARLYLQTSEADSVYTPFSFNFCMGRMFGHSPAVCNECGDSFIGVRRSHEPLCSFERRRGVLGLFLTTEGYTGKTNGPGPVACPSAQNVSLANCRASASIYIDGMMLTAGEGRYLSPVFDSLSPYTQWETMSWASEQNRDPYDAPQFRIRTPVVFTWHVAGAIGDLTRPAIEAGGQQVNADPEIFDYNLPGTPAGRYMRYQAHLVSWPSNLAYPPIGTGTQYVSTCLQHGMEYDGSLSPTIYHVSVAYTPHAGMVVSKPIKPSNLMRWKSVSFGKNTAGGGAVRVDILGDDMTPVVMDDGTVLENVVSGVSLARLDPGKYGSVRVRCLLDRGASATDDPRLEWFKVEYEPMADALALNRNAIHLAQGETVDVRFISDSPGSVRLMVHDTAGQLVLLLFRGNVDPNEIYQRSWDGTDGNGRTVAPGVYFVTVVTPSSRQTERLAVMR